MVNINKLNGGNITITTGSSVLDATKTRITFTDGSKGEYDIAGELNVEWMTNNGFTEFDGGNPRPVWKKNIAHAEIGTTVTSVGFGAFAFSSISSIVIPNSVTSIGSSAFAQCSGITIVTIPDSVTSIGESAFEGCSSLTSVTIPNSVTSIGDFAFYDCSSLTNVMIPNSVTSIGEDAFDGCSGLTSVTITANGGNAANVKQMLISAGVDENITWNMPS